MPRTVSGATHARNARQRPNLAATAGLRVIPGGLNRDSLVTVRLADHDELHAELAVARAERLTQATEAGRQLRAAARHLSLRFPGDAPRIGAAATCLVEALRIVEGEARRATAMDSPCPCGLRGPGHGDVDSDVLPVPLESVA